MCHIVSLSHSQSVHALKSLASLFLSQVVQGLLTVKSELQNIHELGKLLMVFHLQKSKFSHDYSLHRASKGQRNLDLSMLTNGF